MANDTPRKEIDDLKEELGQLRQDMGNVLSAVKNIGQTTARSAKTKAEQELDDMMEKLNRAYISARKTGEQAVASSRDEIENHPVASISIAFLVGLIAGKLFSLK